MTSRWRKISSNHPWDEVSIAPKPTHGPFSALAGAAPYRNSYEAPQVLVNEAKPTLGTDN